MVRDGNTAVTLPITDQRIMVIGGVIIPIIEATIQLAVATNTVSTILAKEATVTAIIPNITTTVIRKNKS